MIQTPPLTGLRPLAGEDGQPGAAGPWTPAVTRSLLPPPAAYLSAVLQTLQHGQVVGPCVLRTEAGQVLPTGLLLRQLPAGRPSRLGGRFILSRQVDGSDSRRVRRFGRSAGHLESENRDTPVEANRERQQRGATVCRHLHRAVGMQMSRIISGQLLLSK